MKKLNKLMFALLAGVFVAPVVFANDGPRDPVIINEEYTTLLFGACDGYYDVFDTARSGKTGYLKYFLGIGKSYRLFKCIDRYADQNFYHTFPTAKETVWPVLSITDSEGNNLFHAIQNMEQLKVLIEAITEASYFDRLIAKGLLDKKNDTRQTPEDVKLREGNKKLWGYYKYYASGLYTAYSVGGVDLKKLTATELADFFGWDKECAKNAECAKNYTANADVNFGEEELKSLEQMMADTEIELPDLSGFFPAGTYRGQHSGS